MPDLKLTLKETEKELRSYAEHTVGWVESKQQKLLEELREVATLLPALHAETFDSMFARAVVAQVSNFDVARHAPDDAGTRLRSVTIDTDRGTWNRTNEDARRLLPPGRYRIVLLVLPVVE